MNIPFVNLKAQYQSIKSEIDTVIEKTLTQTSFIGGEDVKKFEQDFAKLLGVQNVIACANGTDSIEIMLQAMGITKGDEVIVPAISWISTSEAVTTAGGTPIFVDVDENGLMDTAKVEAQINSNTKAIIPVHLYGRTVNMSAIMDVAHRNNLMVLEDCAQAHLAEWNGQKISTIGHCASFSFYPGKNLGAYGDAGAMVVKDDELAEKCRMIANHGQKKKHDHYYEGRNSRMDTLQARVLSVKTKYIKDWTQKRIENAQLYDKYLVDVPQISRPEAKNDHSCVFHLYVIQTSDRDALKTYLSEAGVATAIHYPYPLPSLRPYANDENHESNFPVATKMAKEILSLPMYPELTEEEIKYVCDQIKSFYA